VKLMTTSAKTLNMMGTAGFIWSLAISSPVQAATFWGTTAGGSARQFEITCSTCPNPVSELSNLNDGGFGNLSAHVEFSKPGFASYQGTATLVGPSALPQLGVMASAGIESIISPPDTFFYSATAVASATQLYEYVGGTSRDYTINYDIDGAMAGGILTEIAGGFAVFGAGFNPNQEVQPTLGFSFDHVNGDGTETLRPVHLNGSVTFTVNPGDFFYVKATMDVYADSRSQSLDAIADASHTLSMGFTQGDTSLLVPTAVTPAAASAPEPGSILLMGAGIGLAVAMRRRGWRRS